LQRLTYIRTNYFRQEFFNFGHIRISPEVLGFWRQFLHEVIKSQRSLFFPGDMLDEYWMKDDRSDESKSDFPGGNHNATPTTLWELLSVAKYTSPASKLA
jgi:hypothetical protein